METTALYESLKTILNYLPMVYNQQIYSQTDAESGKFIIKYPYSSVPNNALLFVLPLTNSITPSVSEDGAYINNKLIIKYAKVDASTGEVSHVETETSSYNIFVEEFNGNKRPATFGDIVANKLCMFRFISSNSTDIILCNNSSLNSLKCTDLSITHLAQFHTRPRVITAYNTETGEAADSKEVLIKGDLDTLEQRLTALENKIKIGTEDADKFFETNKDLPLNTVYIQVEE